MFNTINNLSRKADKYGDIHFISFLGATLARLAYFNDNKFLSKYNAIMGPVIHPKILQGINGVPATNLAALLDDQTIFGLNKSTTDIFADYEYQYNGKNFIDFLRLNMPQNVNIINEDIKGVLNFPVPGQQTPLEMVKYISIGWSNYGEIYIVADKRMPNTIFLLFRGTYSAKTASLYSKPTSVIPLTTCKDSAGNPEQFLYGIFKATSEMIHTIVEALRFLATDFLGATQPNSVKIFTTGHSLGGAMCSNFAYLWTGVKRTAPYNTASYSVLADNIVCVSLGAPRCMSKSVAKKFCNFVTQKKILFLRITSRGDPVTALPPSLPNKTAFQHPCSDSDVMRKEISEDCNANLEMRPLPNVNYEKNLDCQNYKTRAYIPNPLSHTIYLDILYTKAVDIVNFLKGMGTSREVLRTSTKGTICRLIMGQGSNYKVIFFDVNQSRETPNNTDATLETDLTTTTTGGGWFSSLLDSKPKNPDNVSAQSMPTTTAQSMPTTSTRMSMPTMKIGGPVAEDKRMTLNAFNSLMQQMVPLQGNLCPQSGQMASNNTFKGQTIMPDLSCPGAVTMIAGKTRKNTKKNNKKYKNKYNKNTKKNTKRSRKH